MDEFHYSAEMMARAAERCEGVDVIRANNDKIILFTKTTFENWDEDISSRFVQESVSMICGSIGRRDLNNDCVALARAVFVDRSIKIRVFATWTMQYYEDNIKYRTLRYGGGGWDIRPSWEYTFNDTSYVPHPEIRLHNSLGVFFHVFNKCRFMERYEDYAMIAITATATVDLWNTINARDLMEYICLHMDYKIFQDKNGNLYNFKEAIEYINKMEGDAK